MKNWEIKKTPINVHIYPYVRNDKRKENQITNNFNTSRYPGMRSLKQTK